MPHVVLEGPLTLERVHRELSCFEEHDAVARVRLRESYLARGIRQLLLETVVIEGVARRFFVAVDEDGALLTVRLHALTDPEKTPGVKRAVARLALRIRALDPAERVVRGNLLAELEDLDA